MSAQHHPVVEALGQAIIDHLFDRCSENLETGCLLWTGCVTKDGYGKIRVGSRIRLVHRLVWELVNRRFIPRNRVVRHTCDNPRCCEPTHLVLGTHEENVADRVERGRSARGERNGRSKLTADSAAAIRRRHRDDGESVSGLAREFGVNPRAIRAVIAGETWAATATATTM